MSADQLTPAWATEVAEAYLTGTLNTFDPRLRSG